MKDPRGLQLDWDQLKPTEAADRLEDPRVAVAERAQRQLSDLQQAAIIGTPSEVKDIIAEYEYIGVDELIVPDFTLGGRNQKMETLDTFIKDVAGR